MVTKTYLPCTWVTVATLLTYSSDSTDSSDSNDNSDSSDSSDSNYKSDSSDSSDQTTFSTKKLLWTKFFCYQIFFQPNFFTFFVLFLNFSKPKKTFFTIFLPKNWYLTKKKEKVRNLFLPKQFFDQNLYRPNN